MGEVIEGSGWGSIEIVYGLSASFQFADFPHIQVKMGLSFSLCSNDFPEWRPYLKLTKISSVLFYCLYTQESTRFARSI